MVISVNKNLYYIFGAAEVALRALEEFWCSEAMWFRHVIIRSLNYCT